MPPVCGKVMVAPYPEPLLVDMRRRIRDVKQGKDGLIYLLTDDEEGVMLRIEPAE